MKSDSENENGSTQKEIKSLPGIKNSIHFQNGDKQNIK